MSTTCAGSGLAAPIRPFVISQHRTNIKVRCMSVVDIGDDMLAQIAEKRD
jgi:hypothetical protein